jgi:hypothetical protein
MHSYSASDKNEDIEALRRSFLTFQPTFAVSGYGSGAMKGYSRLHNRRKGVRDDASRAMPPT